MIRYVDLIVDWCENEIKDLFDALFCRKPDHFVLTYTRGWIHVSKRKEGEPIHGIMLPYVDL